ncbi:hypothetical protein [Brucella sp. 191011898]|uniref:hypothetical protein n=1 Tax=Brucella sp. 191011898 TaxID=2730447 RepID=UPI0015DE5BB0|nr:hypothetical protein [Brucella sp. 191011898]
MLDYLKIGLGVAAGIVIGSVYYNGIPVLKDLPVVGFLFDGQAKKGLVPEFQAAALRAERDELRRQGRANALVIEAYQVQLRNARAAEAAQIEKSEQEIADYEKKLAAAGRSCLLDRDDLQFLRQ